MRMTDRSGFPELRRQAGFGLMEGVIAMGISLVVTASMVALMSNSLSNTSRIVNMTKLSDDLRATMQMLTRDVRRASYNADALLCYGNENCYTDGSITMPGDVVISDDGECFTFQLDRGHNGDGTDDAAGGFRRVETGGIGGLEMWTGGNSPDCDDDDESWVSVSNSDNMNITGFSVNDDQSYTETVFDDGVTVIQQRVRKLTFVIDGELVTDSDISRRMEDVISVRNDILL